MMWLGGGVLHRDVLELCPNAPRRPTHSPHANHAVHAEPAGGSLAEHAGCAPCLGGGCRSSGHARPQRQSASCPFCTCTCPAPTLLLPSTHLVLPRLDAVLVLADGVDASPVGLGRQPLKPVCTGTDTDTGAGHGGGAVLGRVRGQRRSRQVCVHVWGGPMVWPCAQLTPQHINERGAHPRMLVACQVHASRQQGVCSLNTFWELFVVNLHPLAQDAGLAAHWVKIDAAKGAGPHRREPVTWGRARPRPCP